MGRMGSLFLVLLLVLPLGVMAEDDLFAEDEILFGEEETVALASKHETKLSHAPSSVSVITHDEIMDSGANTVAELMRWVVGIDFMEVNSSDINIAARGNNFLATNSMLLTIDGRTAFLDFFGIVPWDWLSLELHDIEKIEIMRGSGSVLYGANAYTGIVNIVTRRPSEDNEHVWVHTGFGNNDSLHTSLRAEARGEKWGLKFTAGMQMQDFYDQVTTFGTLNKNQARDARRGSVYWEYNFNDHTQFSVAAGTSQSEGNFASGLGLFHRNSDLPYVKLNFNWKDLKIQAFYNKVDGLGWPDAAGPLAAFPLDTSTYDLEIQHSLNIGEKHRLTYGGSYRRNKVTTPIFYPTSNSQTLWAVYLQDEWFINERWTLTLGGRFDDHALSGGHFSPRISVVFAPNEKHAFRLSAGKAFLNPTFLESYFALITPLDLNPLIGLPPGTIPIQFVTSLGRTDLEAEDIQSVDLAWNYTGTRVRASLEAWWYETDGDISFGPDLTGDFFFFPAPPPNALVIVPLDNTYFNLEGNDAWGLEFTLKWRASDNATVWFNYSWQDKEEEEVGIKFQSVPENKFNMGFNWEFGDGWQWAMQAHWQDDRTIFDDSTGIPTFTDLDSYLDISGQLSYSRDWWEIGIQGKNLFDDDAVAHPQGDRMGRQAMVYVRLKMQ